MTLAIEEKRREADGLRASRSALQEQHTAEARGREAAEGEARRLAAALHEASSKLDAARGERERLGEELQASRSRVTSLGEECAAAREACAAAREECTQGLERERRERLRAEAEARAHIEALGARLQVASRKGARWPACLPAVLQGVRAHACAT